MATATSFKQQCPSCEAMVPIKDKSLVGRKIDCPKCKYRFVVEAQADLDEEEKPAAAAKKNGKSTAIKNGKPVKGKAAGKRAKPDVDDDEREEKPQQKSNALLFVGIGVAAVAFIGLVIGGLFIGGVLVLGGGGSPPKGGGGGGLTNNGGPQGAGIGGNTGDNTTNPLDPNKKPGAAESGSQLTDISNLLPNDTQAVVNLNIDAISSSSLKMAALRTPGAFSEQQFTKSFSFPIDAVTRVVIALNTDKKTVFSVMRTTKPFDREKVSTSLQLEKQEAVAGLNYFLVKRTLDSLGTFLVRANQPAEKLALYMPDSQTLVFADDTLMQDYLKKGAKPTFLTNPATGSPAGASGGGNPPPGGGVPPSTAPGGGGAGPAVNGLGAGTGGGRGGAAPGSGPAGSGPSPSGGAGIGGGPPMGTAPSGGGAPFTPPDVGPAAGVGAGGGGAPGGGLGGTPGGSPGSVPPPRGSYMTIKERMKSVLDKLEKTERPVLLSMVAEKETKIANTLVAGLMDRVPSGPWTPLVGPGFNPVVDVLKDIDLIGMSLLALNEEKASALVVLEGKDDSAAKKLGTALTLAASVGAPLIGKELLKMDLGLGSSDDAFGGGSNSGSSPGIGGPAMPRGGAGGPPGSGPSAPGIPPMPKGGAGGPPGSGPSAPGVPPRPGGGAPGAGAPPPPPGGGVPPGGGYPPGGGQPGDSRDSSKLDGTISITVIDNTVQVSVDLTLKEKNKFAFDLIVDALRQQMIQLKGRAALAENRSHMHDLAAALKKYTEAKKEFPRGTAFRIPGANRPIDWPPQERLSWMVELLPYLGDGEFSDVLYERDRSWNEGANLSLAQVLIPQFLGEVQSDSRLMVRYPGMKEPVAPTRFIAVSGLGLDAAEYNAKDPSVAKKLGVFGYDRVTKLDDVKDGLESTIALLMVPGNSTTPWLAGGGSTVRGISDDPKDSDVIGPFVCAKHDGKDGTYAIMADCKVRFIPKDIDPKVFRAMCAINSGKRIDNLDQIAPEISAPVEAAPVKKDQPAPPVKPPEPKPQ